MAVKFGTFKSLREVAIRGYIHRDRWPRLAGAGLNSEHRAHG